MPSSSTSNKLLFVVGGAAAVISAILVLSISTLIPTLDGSPFSVQICDNSPKALSITSASGFAFIQSRSGNPTITQDSGLSIQPIGSYEFVLKPGSVGYVKMAYDFCPNAILIQPSRTANFSELNKLYQSNSLLKNRIYKLNDNATSNPTGGLPLTSNDKQLLTEVPNALDVGLTINASDLTKLNSHAIRITYSISAEPSAHKATYVITNFYGICPGELLTIGDEPNDNSLQWSKGPFYGCSG